MKDPLRYCIDEGIVTVVAWNRNAPQEDIAYSGAIQTAFDGACEMKVEVLPDETQRFIMNGVEYQISNEFFLEYARLFDSKEQCDLVRSQFIEQYRVAQQAFQQLLY